ncbi:MAG: outer membrane beta-barrel protein [Candidatus Dadabacteria bacterium]|nr:outer membrane beta-barrel protein [Candidatus Dadabacteria bacterium]
MAKPQMAELMGGEFALTFGAQTGPFDVGTGWFLAGELGIPLMNVESGKIMGLVSIGVGKNDDNISTEPTVNLLEPGLLPEQTEVDLSTVTILLGLKYKLLMHDLVQPFILAGPGINVFLNDTDPGDIVGGIAPQPAELSDRGFPSGQGNVELGLHAGVGVDFNLTEKIFLGGEARINWVDRENGTWGTYGVRTGFRF